MIEPSETPPRRMLPLERRAHDLASLTAETWDVVIVGGGIVGAGALLDAVSRGMRAALVEQDDIAAGTSSRSSRLIHGGLRYLEQFRFGLVREALAERSRLLAIAPHLVRIEPLLFPIYGIPFASKGFYDAGLTLYDILGARHDGGWHRRLSQGRHARPRPDPAPRTGCAAACSTTTGSRTTRATRWPWLARRSPPAAWRSPGSAPRASAPARTAGAIAAVMAEDNADRCGTSRSRHGRRRRHRRLGGRGRPSVRRRLARGSCRAAARTSSSRASASRTRSG